MKKHFVILLSVLMIAAMPLTTYATESGENEITFQCNVTFYITDETTNGYPGSSFTAVMTDTTKTITDSYSFTKGNSWGSGNNTPKYTVIAPTTYTVTFEGLEDGYMIVNTLDLSSDIGFEAVDGGVVDCYWSIIETATTAGENRESGTESTILEQEEKGPYTVSNEEAEEVYKTFLNTVGYIADRDEWYNALLANYELFASSYASWYAEYVENGTEEDFLSMSLFDRFAWTETYLVYAWAVNTGDVGTYFGSEENFENHITSHVTNMIESAPDYEAVEDAYLAIAKWQYDYVQKTGVPYNFISGRSYLEEVGEVPKTETPEKTNEEELEEAARDLLEDADETTKEETEERGIWNDTLNALSKHIFTIAIIIILCVAVMVVVWKRKKLNINDDKDSK